MKFGRTGAYGLRVVEIAPGHVFYDDGTGDQVEDCVIESVKWDSEPEIPTEKGTRYNAGKPSLALLPAKTLIEIAKVLDFGKAKYSAHNWRKGFSYTETLSSAQRHLAEWQEGEGTDRESGLSHLAHAACNLLFLIEFELTNTGTDDRYKKRRF